MKILNRYIFREAWVYFFITVVAFTGMLLTVQMLRFASLIVNKGVSLGDIGMVFIALIPSFLELALPLATLLGIMLAFARLSGDSEIVVARAAGVSLFGLVPPVVLCGLVSFACSCGVAWYLKPWGFTTLSATFFSIARNKSISGLDQGVFNKVGEMTVYAEHLENDSGLIENVVIDDKRDQNRRQIIVAQHGNISSNEQSRSIVITLFDGAIHEIVDGKYVLTRFLSNRLEMSADEFLNTGTIQRGKSPRELYLPEIRSEIEKLETTQKARAANGALTDPLPGIAQVPSKGAELEASTLSNKDLEKRLNRFRVEEAMRYTMPVASLLLALIAMPLGIQPPRTQKTWGATLSILLGIVVFVAYYGLFSIVRAFCEGGKLNPYFALWLPNLLTALFAGQLLFYICSERWHSIAHAFENLFPHKMQRSFREFFGGASSA